MKTRMKEGWMPSKKTILDMMSSCPGVDIQYEKDKFVDYYLSNGGTSANWEAAFRNWIRRASEYRASKGARETGHTETSSGNIQSRRERILRVAQSRNSSEDDGVKRLPDRKRD